VNVWVSAVIRALSREGRVYLTSYDTTVVAGLISTGPRLRGPILGSALGRYANLALTGPRRQRCLSSLAMVEKERRHGYQRDV
jgi:hypothetical protein